MIVNEINKCYRLRRGSVIGKARPLDTNEINIVEPMEVDQPDETADDKEIDVPEKYRKKHYKTSDEKQGYVRQNR